MPPHLIPVPYVLPSAHAGTATENFDNERNSTAACPYIEDLAPDNLRSGFPGRSRDEDIL